MKKQDILDKDTQRTTGTDALTSNIEAAKAVSDIVKSTLGPMGMDKMLIDSMGETIITNDGVKILQEMEVEHPGAKILVDVAKTQEIEVGDGTTSAVILSGELLSQANDLIKKGIHPNTIVRSFKIASNKALEVLEKLGKEVDTNKKVLTDIVQTAMTGKVTESSKEELSEILYEAANRVKEENGIPSNRIKIQKAVGGETKDSFLVEGVVLDKNTAHPNMPPKITNPEVLLIDFPLEVRELEGDAKVNINSLEEYEAFLENEKEYLRNLVIKIKQIGSNVVICQKGIDDSVAYFLAKEGILATRRTRKSDLEKLSNALSCPIVSSYDDITKENLGNCSSVSVKEVLGESYVFVEGCKDTKAVTIFLKASTKHFLDELERAVDDSIGDMNAIIRSSKIVAGGGAIELELHKELSNYSKEFSGREALILDNFAKAFLSIPKTLCQNSGFDELDFISTLISKHEAGEINCGIDGIKGIVNDTFKSKIIEPIEVKRQAIKSAVESSSMILRIDDIIAARKIHSEQREEF